MKIKAMIFLLVLIPATAYANVVWPALFLEVRLFSWWAIITGLFVEFFFIKRLFTCSIKQSSVAVISANVVSAFAGIVLIPLAGIVWEVFPGLILNWALSWGTFNPVTWGATCILGCVINGLLEGAVYKKWFFHNFKFNSKAFVWLLAANTISVGAAYISLVVTPIEV